MSGADPYTHDEGARWALLFASLDSSLS